MEFSYLCIYTHIHVESRAFIPTFNMKQELEVIIAFLEIIYEDHIVIHDKHCLKIAQIIKCRSKMKSLHITIFTFYSERTKEIILYDTGKNINKIVKILIFFIHFFTENSQE